MTNYTEWLAKLRALLPHSDAINCVVDDSIPELWYENGDSEEDAATELNRRYRRGYDAGNELAGTDLASSANRQSNVS